MPFVRSTRYPPILDLVVRSNQAGGGAPSAYVLRATWDSAADQGYTDGQVLDTAGEGVEDGSLTLAETNGTWEALSNKLKFTKTGTAWDELYINSQGVARSFGLGFLADLNLTNGLAALIAFMNGSTTAGNRDYEIGNIWNDLQVHDGGQFYAGVLSLSLNTTYQFAFVVGGFDSSGTPWISGSTAGYEYGCRLFIKGGTFANWTLIWLWSTYNRATLRAHFNSRDMPGTLDNLKIPTAALLGVFVASHYSSFTDANGASLDAITPEVGNAWTEKAGIWEIQSNAAKRTTTSNWEQAVTDTGESDAWVRAQVTTGTTIDNGLIVRDDGVDYWLISSNGSTLYLYEYDGASFTARSSAALAPATNTQYEVRAWARGGTIQGFWHGVRVKYASATRNQTATRHGIYESGSANGQFDSFYVTPLTDANYDTELDGA